MGVALLAAVPAAARRCRPLRLDWHVASGSLAAGAGCDRMVGATDGATDGASRGRFARIEEVSVPYRVDLTWRRIDDDGHHPLELHFLGGWLLLRDGAFGVYLSEAQWQEEGWRERPELSTRREMAVRVEHRGQHVKIWIDGAQLGEWRMANAPALGTIEVGLRGDPGRRSRAVFGGFRVAPLE
jgi:hypothetical protein